MLADWNEDAVKAAADNLTAQGHKAIAIRCDVADDADVEAMVARTVEAFGRLDAACNNAGVQNVLAETAETTREDYDRVMGINLRGEWSCMKFELQQMRKQGGGVSSIARHSVDLSAARNAASITPPSMACLAATPRAR
ncbi:SDR family oxidoreductase [Rhizobium miluonense]|uniref:Short chain dehydrogenase n=1 Tax=Rhizobium miluonense TaxID=411945 RepID=A0A1C3WR27_9HYPH|nr:SDR family oxidoreductase [Rhizobium miluonense]SCB42420.1 short chain dehydrogenase [Rhizobium miluonense]